MMSILQSPFNQFSCISAALSAICAKVLQVSSIVSLSLNPYRPILCFTFHLFWET